MSGVLFVAPRAVSNAREFQPAHDPVRWLQHHVLGRLGVVVLARRHQILGGVAVLATRIAGGYLPGGGSMALTGTQRKHLERSPRTIPFARLDLVPWARTCD